MKIFTTTFLILLGVAACKPTTENTQREKENSDWSMNQPYVVMVSIDGFRHDYAEKFGAENILAIKETGAWTKGMIPSYPSKTFPNHYTLVTGMYPGKHGITSNEFYSVEKNEHYGVGNGNSVLDGSWYGGTPLWVLAEQNNMLAASYFWVGSEATIKGIKPTYVHAYQEDIPNGDRVDEVISWLKLPERERPHMIHLYFSDVDTQGHRYGPDAYETKEAVLAIDEQIGRLRAGIKEAGLPVTLVVTGDHGMTDISEGFSLDVDWRGAEVEYISTHVMVYHKDDDVIDLIVEDLKDVEGLTLYRDEELPEEYHFWNPDRSGDLLIMVEPPVIFSKKDEVWGGTHGYDPYRYPDMHTIFYVEGPNVKPNHEIPPFQNIHVYPLIANILELPIPEDIDGEVEVLKGVLKE